jgi:hypothetical protein
MEYLTKHVRLRGIIIELPKNLLLNFKTVILHATKHKNKLKVSSKIFID